MRKIIKIKIGKDDSYTDRKNTYVYLDDFNQLKIWGGNDYSFGSIEPLTKSGKHDKRFPETASLTNYFFMIKRVGR